MTKKGVSIVIPVWNEAQNIRVLCKQLASLKGLEYEVIFVDGGSTDNSVSLLQSTPHIRYIS
ncbi:MAG: glycosyltransferase, partial [Flavobacteriaceae bacterium]